MNDSFDELQCEDIYIPEDDFLEAQYEDGFIYGMDDARYCEDDGDE